MKVKKGDFIELEYTGKIKGTGMVFDSTDENVAKEAGLHQEGTKYRPAIICVGEGDVVKGIDKELVGKEIGNSYTIEVLPEEGFGKKDAKLLKIVNTNIFIKENINPMPGLQVNMDGLIGTIRTVTGGRTIVDFNHPLAGRNLVYEIKIKSIVKEDADKLKGIIRHSIGIDEPKISIENGVVKVETEIPELVHKQLEEKIKKLLPKIKKVEFKKKEEKKKVEKKEEKQK